MMDTKPLPREFNRPCLPCVARSVQLRGQKGFMTLP